MVLDFKGAPVKVNTRNAETVRIILLSTYMTYVCTMNIH